MVVSLGDFDIDAACPRCGYLIWVRRFEVVAQVTVLCPCCRTNIRLVDESASVQNFDREVERQIEDVLDDLFKGWRR
jgi:uncharacterized Zn finger protein (UPF0148 family)